MKPNPFMRKGFKVPFLFFFFAVLLKIKGGNLIKNSVSIFLTYFAQIDFIV